MARICTDTGGAPNNSHKNGRDCFYQLAKEKIKPFVHETPANGSEADRITADPFKQYCRDVAKFPQLSREDEKMLAARIRKGDNEALHSLVTSNLKLVIKIAKDYEGKGLPILDLVNEGNIGLLTAAKRFNPRKGAKFSYYASTWIKQKIKSALSNQSRTIRIPIHTLNIIFKLKSEIHKAENSGVNSPDIKVIAKSIGISQKSATRALQTSHRIISLDQCVQDSESSAPLSEVIPDENAESADRTLSRKEDYRTVMTLLDSLSGREQVVLRARFGLDGGTSKSLEVVGKGLRLTRERARQLQNIALKKLRSRMLSL